MEAMDFSKAVKLGGNQDLVKEFDHDLVKSNMKLSGCEDVLRSVLATLSEAPIKYQSVLLEPKATSLSYAAGALNQTLASIAKTVGFIADAQHESPVNPKQEENEDHHDEFKPTKLVLNDESGQQRLAFRGMSSSIKANKTNYVVIEQDSESKDFKIATPSRTYPSKWGRRHN